MWTCGGSDFLFFPVVYVMTYGLPFVFKFKIGCRIKNQVVFF